VKRIAEQVARRFVYIVLTAAIAVPVWLATRPHLGTVAHDAAPLDVPASSIGKAQPVRKPEPAEPKPLVASLAPLPAHGDSASVLSLKMRGDSWVQVYGDDGQVIEQGLLHAGEQRSYPLDTVSRVVLGDASVVDVLRDGQAQDLAPFRRANVARFTVSSDGSLAPAVD
jgi:cytoskeleton protein RodZ